MCSVEQIPKWVLVSKALKAAMERLENTPPGEPEPAFAAVGEALWWAIALDGSLAKEQPVPNYKERRKGHPAGDLLRGLESARNAVGHHLVELLEVCDGYPKTWGNFYGDWCWRGVKAKEGDANRAIYNCQMKGQPARETLRVLMPFFDEIIQETALSANMS